MTSSELTAARETLLAAIVSSKLSVSINGRSVTYRSIDELKTALDVIDAQIARAAGRSFTLGAFRKAK